MGLGGWLPLDIPIGIGGDEARQRALDELAKAKYRGGLPPEVEQLLRRLVSGLGRIIGWTSRIWSPPGDSGVNWGFALAVVVLLGGLAFVIWKVGLPKWRRRSASGALELDSTKPAADYRSEAEEHANRGDWRSAVRDRFRAIVRELEVRTILDVRPARTAWEAAGSAARQLPDCRAALYGGADLFNAVMYGDSHPGAAAYAQMVAVDQTVLAAADRADLVASPEEAEAPR